MENLKQILSCSFLFVCAAKGREKWQYDGIAGLSTQQLCQHLAFLPGPRFKIGGTVHPGARADYTEDM